MIATILFYLIVVALVMMIVRPGGQAGEALIAVTEAFAAVIATAEGTPRKAA